MSAGDRRSDLFRSGLTSDAPVFFGGGDGGFNVRTFSVAGFGASMRPMAQ